MTQMPAHCAAWPSLPQMEPASWSEPRPEAQNSLRSSWTDHQFRRSISACANVPRLGVRREASPARWQKMRPRRRSWRGCYDATLCTDQCNGPLRAFLTKVAHRAESALRRYEDLRCSLRRGRRDHSGCPCSVGVLAALDYVYRRSRDATITSRKLSTLGCLA